MYIHAHTDLVTGPVTHTACVYIYTYIYISHIPYTYIYIRAHTDLVTGPVAHQFALLWTNVTSQHSVMKRNFLGALTAPFDVATTLVSQGGRAW